MRSVRDKKIGASNEVRNMGEVFVKSFAILFFVLSSLLSVSAQDLKLPERPNPPRLVNDMAGMLSQDEAGNLENKLVAYGDSTSTQIVVMTINSLEGNDIGQYAIELIHKWGIGQKGKDNGVLLLISKGDHKIFIATGRGVEANLPDITTKRIIDNVITPKFKEKQYYVGINAAIDEMMARLSGQFTNNGQNDTKTLIKGHAKLIALVIVAIILLFLFLGGGSGGGQTYNSGGSSGGSFLLGALLGSALGGGRGGDDGGFGGGGGGFGGFGGGDSGGGGAGGSW